MACNGHVSSTGCHGHTLTGCVGHINSCGGHSGYYPSRAVAFTNNVADSGDIIDYENELNELRDELNYEASRRGLTNLLIPVFDQPVDALEIRTMRDTYVSITGNCADTPISDADIVTGELIRPITVESMLEGFIDWASNCTCNCNYSCTCNCNYCACDCDYCTCQCAYACTCDCNHACICDCYYVTSYVPSGCYSHKN